MTLILDTPNYSDQQYSKGFEQLDWAHRDLLISPEDLAPFRSYILGKTVLMDTPADVTEQGQILTNPSQVIRLQPGSNGNDISLDFAYFRREPLSNHLGKTNAVPLLISKDSHGKPTLSPYHDAMTLVGEDPRVMRNISIRSGTGKIHTGWCVSTVVATPNPLPDTNDATIKQVFYWGKTLTSLQPVAEIDDLKNTCIYPVNDDTEDPRLYVFGRPHPDISFGKVGDISQITKQKIESDPRITQAYLPEGIRCGVNYIKGTPNTSYLELDIHEACQPVIDGRKILHYRLGRYGFELTAQRLIPLGVYAVRSQFPDAIPKPSDLSVASYDDVLYGSLGDPEIGYMVTGIADRHIGLAEIKPM